MKQNGTEANFDGNMDGNRGAILAQIHSRLDSAGSEELELFLIFLDTYLRKKKQKGTGR